MRITAPSLEAGERGFQLRYMEHTPKQGGTYDEPVPHSRELNFGTDEDDKAIDAFRKLAEFYRSDRNANMEEPPSV